ncbi:MAG: hypothetical protein COV72_01830 [Candidatus Omnitrophica bacterium CG11_big_fil_rev_8_21_14_0_20_42_13]|uniref:Uncharacterized protein n=1 Tax=Candidatus Ghiorseimicrobium undicola TaxID=1974746 RepID=A0A2H0LZ60_9BACT|nr:MAG: hypothetical protein COV72_01830 [Candidatus Omnitrophica bacterium CG11_big_fil_rev_8_21_14_0_20_42_13]
MRPKKTRWIKCDPGERCFVPQSKAKSVREPESILLNLDEFEVLRLSHLAGYSQAKIAKEIRIHQSTISRILASAHKKITAALVDIKGIKVEGGCCKFRD